MKTLEQQIKIAIVRNGASVAGVAAAASVAGVAAAALALAALTLAEAGSSVAAVGCGVDGGGGVEAGGGVEGGDSVGGGDIERRAALLAPRCVRAARRAPNRSLLINLKRQVDDKLSKFNAS